MLFRNLILLTLALSSGVAAVRTGRKSSLRTASEERFLPGGTSDGTDADKPASCRKGDVEKNFYNAFFTLEDSTKDCKVTEQCTQEVFLEIGFLIREIVAVLDEEFPKPSVSNLTDIKDIQTNVCPMPGIWIEETNHTARRLGTSYTYKSGGTCRRCYSRCRRLSETQGRKLAEQSSTEMADEACNLANTVEFANHVCAQAVESINHMAVELEDLVVNFDNKDDVNKKCKEVKDISEDVQKLMMKLDGEIGKAKIACSEATDYAAKDDEKRTKECLSNAEDAVEKSLKVAEEVGNLQVKAMSKKKEIEKKLIEQQWAKKAEAIEQMYNDKMEELQIKLKDLDQVKKDLADKLKEAKDLNDYEQIMKVKQAIELLELETKSFKVETEKQKKVAKAELGYENKTTSVYANAIFEATYATDLQGTPMLSCVCNAIIFSASLLTDSSCAASDWMSAYETFLQAKIPLMLLDIYNNDDPSDGIDGCLTRPSETKEYEHFQVKVHLEAKATEEETFIGDCEKQPFDEWDQSDWPADWTG